jgi:lipid-binding SYLF domain-containing protein
MKKILALLLTAAPLLTAPAHAAADKATLNARLAAAGTTLNEILAADDKSIPMNILQQATCVAVVPGLKKAAFVLGGQYGQGVATCRTGHGWSAPVFIRLAGGSFGFQIGGQSTDLVIVAVNQKGFQDMLKSNFKIGADAAASAGPVGRNTQAATDWKMNAELLTWSRSKGLFAGIDLDGTSVSHVDDDIKTFYGQAYPYETILKGNVSVPDAAKPFVRTVAKYFVQSQTETK